MGFFFRAGCWETRCLDSSWTMQSDSGRRRSRLKGETDASIPATSSSHTSEAPRCAMWCSVLLRSIYRRRACPCVADRNWGPGFNRASDTRWEGELLFFGGGGWWSNSPERWHPRIDPRERVSYQCSLCNPYNVFHVMDTVCAEDGGQTAHSHLLITAASCFEGGGM